MVKEVECLLDCRLVKLGPGGGEELLLALLVVERGEIGAEWVRAGSVGVRGGELGLGDGGESSLLPFSVEHW